VAQVGRAFFKAMNFFRKISPYLVSLALFAAFLVSSFYPALLAVGFWCTLAIIVAASGTLVFLSFRKRHPIAPEILPALLAASSFFAMLFVEEIYLRIAISSVAALLFFVLIKQLPFAIAENYFTDLLRAISEWSVLLIIFFTGAGLFAATIFLNFNQYSSFLIFAGISVILAFVLFTLSPSPSLSAAFAFSAVIAESYLVIYLFPFSYWVNAGLLAAIAYTLIGITRGAAGRELKRSAVTAAAAALLLMATARWR
jgi:hypothetical protein